MSFSFTLDGDQILKVLMTERDKARLEVDSIKESFKNLDSLKRICDVKISSTVEAIDEQERNGSPEGALKQILNAEEHYILLNQTLLLAKITHEEMESLNKQICIKHKMHLGQELTQKEREEYIPYDIQDLNEMLRYIYVWDIDHGLQARINGLTNVERYDSMFTDPAMLSLFASEGYLPYFERVRKLYLSVAKELADFADNTFFRNFEVLKNNMDILNKAMGYEPIYAYNIDDGSRDPIGYSVDKEYYNMFYKEMVAEYKQNLEKMKNNEQGKEL